MNTPIIELKGLQKTFGSKQVLQGVDLTIEAGKTTVIIGKSGAGKSVLIKCIIGLIEAERGDILFEGNDITKLKAKTRKETMQRFSYMFQHDALFDSFNVFDNIALPLRENTALPRTKIKQRVIDMLAKLDLAGIEHRFPSELSGGMQKRVALARALITEPDIVLFDEPTAGLDPIRKNTVFAMIEQYQKVFAFTAVIVTHELPDALFIADSVGVLESGKIVFQGPPLEFEQGKSSLSKLFLESDEALKQLRVGLRSEEALKNEYDAQLARANAWVLLSLSNYQDLQNNSGRVTAQTLFTRMAATLRASEKLKGTAYAWKRGSMLICLDDSTMDDEWLYSFLADTLNRDILLGEASMNMSGVEVDVAYAYGVPDSHFSLEQFTKNLSENLVIAFQIKAETLEHSYELGKD